MSVKRISKCPICGASIKAWETRVYSDVTVVFEDGDHEEIVEHDNHPDHADIEEVECEGGHSIDKMITAAFC